MHGERLVHLRSACVHLVDVGTADRTIEVREENEEGHALVQIVIPAGLRAVSLGLSGGGWPFLASGESADGHLLVEDADGWTAHVIECKKTVKPKTWDKARSQIAASMVRLQLLADFLGLPIARWHAWVAF